MQLLRRAASEPRDRHRCGGGGYAPLRAGGAGALRPPRPARPCPARPSPGSRGGRAASHGPRRRLPPPLFAPAAGAGAERRAGPPRGVLGAPAPPGSARGGAAGPGLPRAAVGGRRGHLPHAVGETQRPPVWRRRGQKRGHRRPPQGDGAARPEGLPRREAAVPPSPRPGAARPRSSLGAALGFRPASVLTAGSAVGLWVALRFCG